MSLNLKRHIFGERKNVFQIFQVQKRFSSLILVCLCRITFHLSFLILFAGAVKRNPVTTTNTKVEVEKAVGIWLLGCRDREGNRLKRARREEEKRRIKTNAANAENAENLTLE